MKFTKIRITLSNVSNFFWKSHICIWCVLAGLTAVSSSEVLDIMFQDFPDQYEELRKNMRDKAARELINKQKGLWLLIGRLKERDS